MGRCCTAANPPRSPACPFSDIRCRRRIQATCGRPGADAHDCSSGALQFLARYGDAQSNRQNHGHTRSDRRQTGRYCDLDLARPSSSSSVEHLNWRPPCLVRQPFCVVDIVFAWAAQELTQSRPCDRIHRGRTHPAVPNPVGQGLRAWISISPILGQAIRCALKRQIIWRCSSRTSGATTGFFGLPVAAHESIEHVCGSSPCKMSQPSCVSHGHRLQCIIQ